MVLYSYGFETYLRQFSTCLFLYFIYIYIYTLYIVYIFIEPRTSCIPCRRANHYTTAVFNIYFIYLLFILLLLFYYYLFLSIYSFIYFYFIYWGGGGGDQNYFICLHFHNGKDPTSVFKLSRLVGKPALWFPNRSDTNRPVQAQKRANVEA